ncbi:PulJ/GspJ family protein [Microbacterium oleivorans]|uniref:PulJ/GspJ family protein n=1 Tax=Microbacterium oleivorans TaxID=273677 RepID=UPI00204012A7|nr:prepilin-type N-terminal cleavage/methylation domain-containing protein [Microbacterium oleivorans]MCM3697668.1 prepilin-type N-terminal cleavage/methylation domain-containing protein [Microbacterium oleivorans]
MTGEPAEDDAGMTLVELMIAVFVGSVLLALVATILATTLQATAATRDRDLATGRVQAISTSLTTSLRTAASVTVESPAAGGAVLRALVATGESGWTCRAWAVTDLETTDAGGRRSGADGLFELRTRSYAPLSAAASPPQPTAAWGLLAESVRPAAPGAAYFTVAAGRASWNLAVSTSQQPRLSSGDSASVAGSAVVRARHEGTARCW